MSVIRLRTSPATARGASAPANAATLRRLEQLAELRRDIPSPAVSRAVLVGLARAVEWLILMLAGLAALLADGGRSGEALRYALLPGAAFAAVAAFQTLGVYQISAFLAPLAALRRIAISWAAVVIGLATMLGFVPFDLAVTPRMFGAWGLLAVAVLTFERFALGVIVARFARAGRLDRRTVVVGSGELAERLIGSLAKVDPTEARLLGVFDDRFGDRVPDVVAGVPVLGTIDDLVALAREARIDLIIFTLPITAESRIAEMLRKLSVLPVDVRLAAHTSRIALRPQAYSYVGSEPMLDVLDKPLDDWEVVEKAIFDRVVGAIALVVLSPLMIAAAIAVKLDSKGPVLFRQQRYGFNNERIEIFKFRSMYVDRLDPTAARLVTRDDPRVTRVGRFLRRTSIDELPQLFNVVFAGDLSLVGPRPHALHATAANYPYEEVVESYFARHRVKPGITGWAQINGWRGETDTEEKLRQRVDHDLHYIENWSLLLDIYILAKTPFALIDGRNAY